MSGHEFAQRVALVTGGSGGIGAELSVRLAAAGAVVGVHYGSDQEAGLSRQASYEAVDAAAFDETLAVNLRALTARRGHGQRDRAGADRGDGNAPRRSR